MTRKDDQLAAYLENTPLVKTRTPQSASDFGDVETVGLCLKRRGYTIADDAPEPFGRYLGQHGDEFVVGIVPVTGFDIVGIEVYTTLDELKQEWQLD